MKKTRNRPDSGKSAARAQPSWGLATSRRGPALISWLLAILAISVVGVEVLPRLMWESKPPLLSLTTPAKLSATFVGAAECATCHEQENASWRGSHHQLAMQPASDSTVLGDFNKATFNNNGIKSGFFRSGSKFMVHTDGPDGSLHDYEIKFTFGLYPLQQYLIEMSGGRLQALGIAWDSRPPERGGHRWFALYPGER
jgi:hypothetical protein